MKKYESLNVILNDIINNDKNLITVDLEFWNNKEFITSYDIDLDITKMGYNKDMDYAFDLSKSISRVVSRYYEENNNLPTIEEIKNNLYGKEVLIVENIYNKNDNIEREKIFKNELPIENIEQLSYSIYNAENCIDNIDSANDIIKTLLDNANKIYDFLDQFENNEVEDNGIDIYQLGDLINFVETIKLVNKVGEKSFEEQLKELAKKSYNDLMKALDNDRNYTYDEETDDESGNLYVKVFAIETDSGYEIEQFLFGVEYNDIDNDYVFSRIF